MAGIIIEVTILVEDDAPWVRSQLGSTEVVARTYVDVVPTVGSTIAFPSLGYAEATVKHVSLVCTPGVERFYAVLADNFDLEVPGTAEDFADFLKRDPAWFGVRVPQHGVGARNVPPTQWDLTKRRWETSQEAACECAKCVASHHRELDRWSLMTWGTENKLAVGVTREDIATWANENKCIIIRDVETDAPVPGDCADASTTC